MKCEMRGVKIKIVHSVKYFGVTVTSNLNFPQQYNESVKKVNRMVSLIKIKFSFKNKDVVLPLYNSFIKPQMEYAVQFWSPRHAKDIAKLSVQCRTTMVVPSLRNELYEERLSHLNVFFLEKNID